MNWWTLLYVVGYLGCGMVWGYWIGTYLERCRWERRIRYGEVWPGENVMELLVYKEHLDRQTFLGLFEELRGRPPKLPPN